MPAAETNPARCYKKNAAMEGLRKDYPQFLIGHLLMTLKTDENSVRRLSPAHTPPALFLLPSC